MADKEEKAGKAAPGPVTETIEALAARHKVPPWTMAGLKAAEGWGAGKELTEADFLGAMNKWLSGPMRRDE